MTEGTGRSYRVLERLGQGAFGAVYLAETEGGGLSRRVAIKVPHPDRAGPGLVERLRDEARLLALIRHRAIVRVDDLVELDGAWSVVMEYVEGCDLTELIADAPVPPRPALAIAEEVAQALHAAYHQTTPDGTPIKLLHRDIKPSNLRITPAGEVKILDFGVARAEFGEREAAATQSVFGTTSYLAPERYHGEDSRAGDVYALGVTLFEMLTGVTPGKSAMDADRQPPGRKLAAQWTWLESVSPELKVLVAGMLAMEPGKRPSARDAARQLGEIRAALGGTTLEDWAEKVVPPKIRGAQRERDDRTGSLLIERSTSQARQRAPAISWGWIAGASFVGLVIVISAALAGAAWQAGWTTSGPTELQPVTTTVVEPDATPAAEPPPAELAPGDPSAAEPAPEGLASPGGAEPLAPGVGPTDALPAGAPGGGAGGGVATSPEAPGSVPAGSTATPAPSATAPTSGTTASRTAPSTTTAAPTTTAPASPSATSSPAASPSPTTTAATTPAAPATSAPTTGPSGTTTAGTNTASPSTATTSAASAARPPTTAAPSTPVPAGSARLVVTGEVSSFQISGPKGPVKAGNVPPGTYTVEAVFTSGERATLEGVAVTAGQSVTVRCSSVFRTCKASPS